MTRNPTSQSASTNVAAKRDDEQWMRVALRAGHRGRPSPNPHVGAALVHGGRLLSEGHHERAGGTHAEIAALRSAATVPTGATLYVTLEPCNHHGRTPPCTEAILAAGIGRVVFACSDPNRVVKGGGAARLREAGVRVTSGVLEEEARFLLAPWAKVQRTGLAHVTVARRGSERTECAFDAEWLTSGEIEAGVAPSRNALMTLVTDAQLTSIDALVAHARTRFTYVLCSGDVPQARVQALADAGGAVLYVPFAGREVAKVSDALCAVATEGLVSLLVTSPHVTGRVLHEGRADVVVPLESGTSAAAE